LRKPRPTLNLPALAPCTLAGSLVYLSKLFKALETIHGIFAVWATGDMDQEIALDFVAPRNGPRVPTAPAVLLARKLFTGGIAVNGAYPCVGFFGAADFAVYPGQFSIVVVHGENGVSILP
jgi:hypothetical protein